MSGRVLEDVMKNLSQSRRGNKTQGYTGNNLDTLRYLTNYLASQHKNSKITTDELTALLSYVVSSFIQREVELKLSNLLENKITDTMVSFMK